MATVHMTNKYRIELWAVIYQGQCVATFMSEQAANRRAMVINKVNDINK